MPTRLDLSHVRMLVLADAGAMTRLLETTLRSLGVQAVDAAADIDEALFKAEAGAPDLAIVDLETGSDDGLRFVRFVRRASSAGPSFPILALTARPSIQRVREAVLSGADDVLRKPVSVGTIHDHMADAVLRPRPLVAFGDVRLPLPRGMSLDRARSMSAADLHAHIARRFEARQAGAAPDAATSGTVAFV